MHPGLAVGRRAIERVVLLLPVDVGPRIRRVVQQPDHVAEVGLLPGDLTVPGTTPDLGGDLEPLANQLQQDLMGDLVAAEQPEDVGQPRLDLSVGVLDHGSRFAPHVPDRQRARQLTAAGLVPTPLVESSSKCESLCFRYRTLHPEQEPVVGIARIVDRRLVGQERSRHHADLHEPVPIGGGSRQPRRLECQHHADLTGADLRQERLKALAVRGPGPRPRLILVDDLDELGRPAQRPGAFGQSILSARTLPVVADLMRARLADVDDRLPAQVLRPDLGMSRVPGHVSSSRAEHDRRPSALRTMPEKR